MPSRTCMLLFLSLFMVLMTARLGPIAVQAQAYSVSFMVVGLPAGIPTRYFVDGVFNATIQIGESKVLYFTPGSVHTLSIDLMIGEYNGTRYLCRDNLWSFSEAGIHVFTYIAQHRLEIVSEYDTATGSDWYDEGTTAYAQLTTNVTDGPEGVRHVFVRWEGDASGTGLVSDPILMDRPKKAVASWKTQYVLHVSSDPAGVFPPIVLWLDEGSVTDYSALEATIGNTTRYVFMEWVGDFAGTGIQLSLRMDSPKSVTAKYKIQYLLTLVFTPPEIGQYPDIEVLRHICSNGTWCDSGQIIKLGPVPTVFGNDTARLRLLVWKIDGLTQQGPSLDIQMSGPHVVELAYGRECYLNVTSRYGQVSGSGWYPSGQSARFSVTYQGPDFPVRHRFIGWESTPSTTIVLGEGAEGSVIVDRSYVIDAVWEDDYTLVWASLVIVILSVIVIAGVGVIALRRPGYFRRLFSSLRRGLGARKIRAMDRGPVAPPRARVCPKCGANVPGFAEYCQSCGTSQIMSVGTRPDLTAMDDRVYEYVVKQHGEISLSQASADLGIPVDELKKSTERLKKKGRLG